MKISGWKMFASICVPWVHYWYTVPPDLALLRYSLLMSMGENNVVGRNIVLDIVRRVMNCSDFTKLPSATSTVNKL